MKRILISTLLVIGMSLTTMAQATLEHTYNPGGLPWPNYRPSVGWYYAIWGDGVAKAYDDNHQLLASITVPDYQGWTKQYVNISPDIYDNDPNTWEAIVYYYSTGSPVNSIVAIVRNNSTVQVVSDYNSSIWASLLRVGGEFKLAVARYNVNNYIYDYTEIYDLVGTYDPNDPNEIPETDGDSRFAVYPNPATGFVNVPSTEGSTIELWSSSGQLVRQVSATTSSTTVDVAGLAPGQYAIRENGEFAGSLIVR